MPEIKNIALFGQTLPLKMGLIASFGYFDFVGNPTGAITDHVQRALNLLVEQFERRENLNEVAAIFIKQIQDAENVLNDLLIMKNLDIATGDRLDILGEIVGVDREFRTDDVYREAIRLQIFINKSSGEPGVVIAAFKSIVKPIEMHIRETGNANLLINFRALTSPPSNLRTRIEQVASSGVKIILTWAPDNDPDFAFDGEGGFPPEANTLGFGETGAGNENEGGKFVEIIT